jgi:hypothetical protein
VPIQKIGRKGCVQDAVFAVGIFVGKEVAGRDSRNAEIVPARIATGMNRLVAGMDEYGFGKFEFSLRGPERGTDNKYSRIRCPVLNTPNPRINLESTD